MGYKQKRRHNLNDTSELTIEEKVILVNIAEHIIEGKIPLQRVTQLFMSSSDITNSILQFWLTFNDTTKQVVSLINTELAKQYLELCYDLSEDDQDY